MLQPILVQNHQNHQLKQHVMYESVKEYYQFLNELEKQKEEFLLKTKESVNNKMDIYMSEHGWTRKGKGQKVTYTKKVEKNRRCVISRGFCTCNWWIMAV